jgi:hypothetical protein
MRSVAFVLLLVPLLASASNEVLIYRCTDARGHDTYQDAPCPINSFEHVIRMQRPLDSAAPAAPLAAPPPPVPPEPPGTADESESTPEATPEPVKFSLPPWETEADEDGVALPPRGYSLPPWETGDGEDQAAAESAQPAADMATKARERGFSLPPWESEASITPQAEADEPPAIKLRPTPRPSPPPLWRCRGLDRKAYISDTASPPPKCIPLRELGVDLSALPQDQRDGCRDVHDACDQLDDAAACEHYDELRGRAALAAGDLPLTAVPELRAEFLRLDQIWKHSCSLQ